MAVDGSDDSTSFARLLGRWRLLRADADLEFAPDVRMEFQDGGRLRYEFAVGHRRQALMLLWRIEGDMLHTDNPAASHARSTRFSFGAGGILILDFVGASAWFVREW